MIVINSKNWANRHKREFDAVITIEDVDKRNGLRFHSEPHPPHLILKFVDLDQPFFFENGSQHPYLIPATREQVQSALDFSKENTGSLLIHCQVGVSRSTAIALGIIAMRMIDNSQSDIEKNALDELLRIRPIAVPNLMVLHHADNILGTKLVDVVKQHDKNNKQTLKRREINHEAHLRYYGINTNQKRNF